ncbi:MAG: XdhC family protein [Candidatus Eremiobacteraeota bacterium]|nr:XdhC family protein [Candidatus Eremiobacteraeota bacterium]
MSAASSPDVLARVGELLRAGRSFAICTVVRPQSDAGYKVVLDAAGSVIASTAGTLLRAPAGAAFVDAVRQLLASGQSRIVAADGQEIFVDVCLPRPQLIIVGAVHIGMALCEMAARASFAVTVVDPRPALNNRERFPKAAGLRVGWPQDELPALRFEPASTYLAVLAHDEKFDDPSVTHGLREGLRYVGAIGSKRTQAARRERLASNGITAQQLARLHGPIGLDIGAQTPEEIAVAILSEMIAVRNERSGARLSERSEPHIHV